MYPNPTINQYNSYQYQVQPPQSQPPPSQQPYQAQQAPALPLRPNTNPNDPTSLVINKLKLQYNGISPPGEPVKEEKIRLTSSTAERIPFERKADLYAILVGLEYLESAFLRDAIAASQYTSHCNRFLSQYKTWLDVHSSIIESVTTFVRDTGLNCPAALNRIKAGIPATSVHGGNDASTDTGGLMTVDLAEKFITTHDIARVALGLENPKLEVENIFSYLSDLLDSLLKYPNLPSDHEIKLKVQYWVQFCSAKPNCYYEFSLEELRQLAFDLENCYSNFRKFVANRKS
jgi:ESCRT-I complex subunit VPS28